MESFKGKTSNRSRSRKLPLQLMEKGIVARMSRTQHRVVSLCGLFLVAMIIACHSLTPVLSLPKQKSNFDGFGLFRTTRRPGLVSSTQTSFGFGTEYPYSYPDSDETPVTVIPRQSNKTTSIPKRTNFGFGYGTENPDAYPNSGKSDVTPSPGQLEMLMYHITRLESLIRENSQSIRTLQSGWSTIQRSLLSNQSHIPLIRGTPVPTTWSPYVTTESPDYNDYDTNGARTYTGYSEHPFYTTGRPNHPQTLSSNCGGVIPMLNVGDSQLLSYKEDQTYGNNERCLWTLNNVAKTTRSKQKIKIVILKHGFAESVDWLYALKFNRDTDTGLVSKKIKYGREYVFNEDQLYLSFTSDSSVTGTGFVIQLDVLESDENGRGLTSYKSLSPGGAQVEPYVNNDLTNFVINPQTNISFKVNYVRTEDHRSCDYDRLMVWEIGEHSNITPRGRFCGVISNTDASFNTDNPVIALFTSDDSNTGPSNAGFRISWS